MQATKTMSDAKTPSATDMTRRMVCGGLAGMIAKVSLIEFVVGILCHWLASVASSHFTPVHSFFLKDYNESTGTH